MAEVHSGAAVFRYRGLKMVGVLNRPGGPERRRHPAVLMLHGFPGAEKNVDIQRRLLDRGVASLALHFCGAWGSEGEYSFSGLVDQAKAGLRFLASREFVDPKRLGVFGFSMGAWAALNLTARTPELKCCAAVAPVGGPELVSDETYAFVERLSRPLRVRSVRGLGDDFVDAVSRFDPAESVARLDRPLLLVHGTDDPVVPVQVSRRLAALARPKPRLVLAKGARHDFLDRRPWLTKLVSDWLIGSLGGGRI